jgi:hypothetical protein
MLIIVYLIFFFHIYLTPYPLGGYITGPTFPLFHTLESDSK